ncbi:hypothetical protein ACJDU8_02490 [Clostridium sp. WILCCON 0269]|uniref:Uncharacterized protein n=1 Tax=Candidatus Clostridium eludens TaxID=3381663 RepID=A0ABW8SHU6_9CLOT
MLLTLENLGEMKLHDFIFTFEKQCNVKLAYVGFNSHSNLDALNNYIHNLNKDRQVPYDLGDVAKLLDIDLKKQFIKKRIQK